MFHCLNEFSNCPLLGLDYPVTAMIAKGWTSMVWQGPTHIPVMSPPCLGAKRELVSGNNDNVQMYW